MDLLNDCYCAARKTKSGGAGAAGKGESSGRTTQGLLCSCVSFIVLTRGQAERDLRDKQAADFAAERKAFEEEKKRLLAAAGGVKQEGLEREVDIRSLNLSSAPVIGVGGFGRVHRCVYRSTDVAVKTLVTAGTAQELNDFKKEIALVLSLSHPRLVNFSKVVLLFFFYSLCAVAACTKPPELALVMEWMEGKLILALRIS